MVAIQSDGGTLLHFLKESLKAVGIESGRDFGRAGSVMACGKTYIQWSRHEFSEARDIGLQSICVTCYGHYRLTPNLREGASTNFWVWAER